MDDFAEQLRRAEELAKKHGSMIDPTAGQIEKSGLWIPTPKAPGKYDGKKDDIVLDMSGTVSEMYFGCDLAHGTSKDHITLFDYQKKMLADLQALSGALENAKTKKYNILDWLPQYGTSDGRACSNGWTIRDWPVSVFNEDDVNALCLLGNQMVTSVIRQYATWRVHADNRKYGRNTVRRTAKLQIIVQGREPKWFKKWAAQHELV